MSVLVIKAETEIDRESTASAPEAGSQTWLTSGTAKSHNSSQDAPERLTADPIHRLRPRTRKIFYGGPSRSKTPIRVEGIEVQEKGPSQSQEEPTASSTANIQLRGVGSVANELSADPRPQVIKQGASTPRSKSYGLTPGSTPFPKWIAPSVEQCEEVYAILARIHSDVAPHAPQAIPAPSLEIAGCGEVPSVLDALLRTLLSGATTFENADRMIKGLVEKFGVLEDGIGKGSIDWNKVRESPKEDLVEAIRVGGLANKEATSIKTILDMVFQDNLQRREASVNGMGSDESIIGDGTEHRVTSNKCIGTIKAETKALSLDHMRDYSTEKAMREFTKYPGVGVKTSACVILFCLQRPCLAVDTHVDKFARWLGWVPRTASVDQVFSHLEFRCPDSLKYGLHQLLIRHGKSCGKCRRDTVVGTGEWHKTTCPLEHLLDRYDKKQPTARIGVPRKRKSNDKDTHSTEDERG